MKSYKEYLIEEYGYKEASRILEKQYFFDRKTVQKIKEYKPRNKIIAFGHSQQYELKTHN